LTTFSSMKTSRMPVSVKSSSVVSRWRGHRLLAARGQHRQRGGQDGAAHAKAQRVDLLGAGDVLHRGDGLDGGLLDVVVPGLFHRRVGVAPAHHEGAVPWLTA
jgi:hypothetical protein